MVMYAQWKILALRRASTSFLTFLRPNFFLARLDFSPPPLTAPGTPRMVPVGNHGSYIYHMKYPVQDNDYNYHVSLPVHRIDCVVEQSEIFTSMSDRITANSSNWQGHAFARIYLPNT